MLCLVENFKNMGYFSDNCMVDSTILHTIVEFITKKHCYMFQQLNY